MKPDIEANTFKDNVASRASISEEVRRFSGGVERRDEGSDQPKYLEKADELIMPERTTMQVSMRDIQVHNDQLQETIGLTEIMGQEVRTQPVHPELVSGTFLRLDCQTVVSGVDQQFKYTQPAISRETQVLNVLTTSFILS